jgi:hypothetical protein
LIALQGLTASALRDVSRKRSGRPKREFKIRGARLWLGGQEAGTDFPTSKQIISRVSAFISGRARTHDGTVWRQLHSPEDCFVLASLKKKNHLQRSNRTIRACTLILKFNQSLKELFQ